MSRQRRCDPCVQYNTTQPCKEQRNVICSNMYATRDYYTNQGKSERER